MLSRGDSDTSVRGFSKEARGTPCRILSAEFSDESMTAYLG